MKSVDWRYALFAIAGALTGIAQQPFFHGTLRLPEAVYVVAPGVIFALLTTVSAILLLEDCASRVNLIKRYILGSVVLAVGMPIALAAGAASLVTVQHILPGDRFQLGGIGLSSLLGELVSCVIWSFVIFVWMILVNETQARRVLRVIFIVTIAILLGCSLMEIISKSFWQKSFFLPLISIAEDMGTTLVLATGVSKHWARRSRGVIEA